MKISSIEQVEFVEKLTVGAEAWISSRAFGTVFLTCLMTTGPVAGVGFSLMAGTITPSHFFAI